MLFSARLPLHWDSDYRRRKTLWLRSLNWGSRDRFNWFSGSSLAPKTAIESSYWLSWVIQDLCSSGRTRHSVRAAWTIRLRKGTRRNTACASSSASAGFVAVICVRFIRTTSKINKLSRKQAYRPISKSECNMPIILDSRWRKTCRQWVRWFQKFHAPWVSRRI